MSAQVEKCTMSTSILKFNLKSFEVGLLVEMLEKMKLDPESASNHTPVSGRLRIS